MLEKLIMGGEGEKSRCTLTLEMMLLTRVFCKHAKILQ